MTQSNLDEKVQGAFSTVQSVVNYRIGWIHDYDGTEAGYDWPSGVAEGLRNPSGGKSYLAALDRAIEQVASHVSVYDSWHDPDRLNLYKLQDARRVIASTYSAK